MRSLILSLIFVSTIILACNFDEDKNELPLLKSERIEDVTLTDSGVVITVSCMLPNPCYEYKKYVEDIYNNDIFVKFYMKNPPSTAVCLQVIKHIDVKYVKDNLKNGVYTFHFMQNDSTSVDTTITINKVY